MVDYYNIIHTNILLTIFNIFARRHLRTSHNDSEKEQSRDILEKPKWVTYSYEYQSITIEYSGPKATSQGKSTTLLTKY